MLIHTVYFWLKPGMSDDERNDFVNRLVKLGEISSVKAFYWGIPAKTTPRPVIDSTYDYSITVVVDDVAGHDLYQEDPIHQHFVKQCGPYFERVQVFDAETPR